MLIPGQGFRDIYDNFNSRVNALVAGFINVDVHVLKVDLDGLSIHRG